MTLVPGIAAVIENVRVGREDPVGDPVLPHVLPDVLDWVQLGRFRRQRHQGDVGRHLQLARDVPASLVEQQHRMAPGATACEISARCSVIASVVQRGSTRPAPLPSAGQIAPKM